MKYPATWILAILLMAPLGACTALPQKSLGGLGFDLLKLALQAALHP